MNASSHHRSVVAVALVLLALWAASWGLSYAHLGRWSFAIAVSIAAAKAVLVALFFMELVAARFTVRVTVLAAGGLVATMIALMAADIATRFHAPLTPGSHSERRNERSAARSAASARE
jgi:cytochrome c oxidase subunit 4